MDKKKVFQIFILILLISWYGLFLFHKIDLTTADLGRHIKNGELVLSGDLNILKSNFYSYTEPDFQVINHHWGGGVIFYIIFKVAGFAGLSFFYFLLSLFIFYIFFYIAKKESNFSIAFIVSLLLIPLIAQRTEIRPEIFSYLFIALFFWILWKWRKKEISYKWLFVLPILEIFWVNTHIYFIFGPALIGLFLVDRLISKKKVFNKFGLILILTSLATLINPFFIKAVLEPFNIFKDYGYRIVENQSVWFLQNLGIINNPNLILYEIVFGILVLSFIAILILRRKRFSFIYFCLTFVWSILGWLAIRNFTIFGLFALPIIAYNIKNILNKKVKFKSLNAKMFFVFVSLAIFLISFMVYYQKLPLNKFIFGLGLMQGNNQSADFLKDNNIKGPIFNNYDIGGYLIYHFYPQEKVFTDNRPEAYSIPFFEDIYIPAQQDNSVWQEQIEKYNFNAIFFSHRDYTPWGQNFLIERIKDPEWAVIYYDSYIIIFLKRNDINKSIIDQYEILWE
ncbi:MAG: hypothetical protein V1901_02500 [Patescibacteria group bacterium]